MGFQNVLFWILEVPVSNLGPQMGYSEIIPGFPQSFQTNMGIVYDIRL
jgi:hypothetical protein